MRLRRAAEGDHAHECSRIAGKGDEGPRQHLLFQEVEDAQRLREAGQAEGEGLAAAELEGEFAGHAVAGRPGRGGADLIHVGGDAPPGGGAEPRHQADQKSDEERRDDQAGRDEAPRPTGELVHKAADQRGEDQREGEEAGRILIQAPFPADVGEEVRWGEPCVHSTLLSSTNHGQLTVGFCLFCQALPFSPLRR